jgi:hypothetical protein
MTVHFCNDGIYRNDEDASKDMNVIARSETTWRSSGDLARNDGTCL